MKCPYEGLSESGQDVYSVLALKTLGFINI